MSGVAKLVDTGREAPAHAPPVRVAYLVNQYPKVSHAFIRREILALEALGVDVLRITVRPANELVDAEDRAEAARTRSLLAGGTVALLGAGLRAALSRPLRFLRALGTTIALGRRSERGVLRHLAYLFEAARLRAWLAAAGATHLHAHFGTNPAAVAMLCRVLGGPTFSFTVHGPEEFDGPSALSLDTKIAAARFVVAISSYGRSQLFRWCPADAWAKVHVVRCAVDESWLQAPLEPIDAASRRLVCVGRLCEQKGQLLLVRAAARLRAAGIAFELVLVGDGEMRPLIEGEIARNALHDCVHITGWASGDQVREHVRRARAMVLPSFAEGLPVVLMEALASGRPVVSTAIAGIPELVRDGENGWLITAGDVDALTGAMQAALEAPLERLLQMGAAGREAVRNRHRAADEAARLSRLFAGDAGHAADRP